MTRASPPKSRKWDAIQEERLIWMRKLRNTENIEKKMENKSIPEIENDEKLPTTLSSWQRR